MTQVCGLYTVKDEYFARFDKNHLMLDNKEEKRPYYCGIRAGNGLLWLIPLSSKIEKYSQLIERYEVNCGKGKCVFCYIAKRKGRKSFESHGVLKKRRRIKGGAYSDKQQARVYPACCFILRQEPQRLCRSG